MHKIEKIIFQASIILARLDKIFFLVIKKSWLMY